MRTGIKFTYSGRLFLNDYRNSFIFPNNIDSA